MKNVKLILLISTIIFSSCKSKSIVAGSSQEGKINVELKNTLEKILMMDQGIREIVNGNLSEEKKAGLLNKMNIDESEIQGEKLFTLMQEIDSINLIKVEDIIKEYGYPGIAMVGEPANKAAFYVIQHSPKIEKYLPLLRKAADEGEIPQTSLAMMEDRYLMDKGLEQLYGTQIKGKANNKGEWIFFVWPVKNQDKINILRKEAGFDTTIEEYLEAMDVEYKFYNLNEIEQL